MLDTAREALSFGMDGGGGWWWPLREYGDRIGFS